MSWRRDVETLVRPPRDVPAVLVTVARGIPTVRVVHAGGALFDRVGPGLAPDPAGARITADAALPFADASVGWLVLSFLGDASAGRRRAAVLADVARVTTRSATIVVVDHNRPRRLLDALVAVVRQPRPPLVRAWHRLAYPTARELRAAGFVVDRLRLAMGERIQVVVAHRRS